MNQFESYFAKQLEAYIAYRKHLGYAMKNSSISNLKTFDRYIKKKKNDGSQLKPSFFIDLKGDVNIEPTSLNHLLSSISSFFNYLVRKGAYNENPLQDVPRVPENDVIPFIFYPEEVEQLLTAVCQRLRKTSTYYLIDYSRYIAILLLAHCGMRITEVLKLKYENYRKYEKSLYIEKTKFNKDRLIPVPQKVASEIENYLGVRKQLLAEDNNSYLLVGIKEARISDSTLREQVFHRAVKDIGLNYPRQVIGTTNFSKPTPHSLRHSFAINTLNRIKEEGNSPQNALPVLAAYLGHVSYIHTATYLKLMDARQHRRLLSFAKKREDEK